MSTNLLGKVTPEPMHYAGQGILTTLDGEDEIALGLLYDDSPDGQLHALAYDHALWGAAATAIDPRSASRRRAQWEPFSGSANVNAGRGQVVVHGEGIFQTTLDAFGCPALTPKLRVALRAALGLK